MPQIVACAVVRGDPPEVFIAENEEALNWALALHLIAQTPGNTLQTDFRDSLRDALRDERWGDAVILWMERSGSDAVDVYGSHDLYVDRDIELGALELDFTPLFRD